MCQLRAVDLGRFPWAQSLCGIGSWIEDHGEDSLRQQMEAIGKEDAALYRQIVDLFCALPDSLESSPIKPSNGLNIVSFVDGLLCTALSEETHYRKLDLAKALVRLMGVFGKSSVISSTTIAALMTDTDVAGVLLEGLPNPTP